MRVQNAGANAEKPGTYQSQRAEKAYAMDMQHIEGTELTDPPPEIFEKTQRRIDAEARNYADTGIPKLLSEWLFTLRPYHHVVSYSSRVGMLCHLQDPILDSPSVQVSYGMQNAHRPLETLRDGDARYLPD